MMGWIILLVAALIVGALVWRWSGLGRSGMQFAAAFIMLALAGYAWQGNPGQAGTPVSARAKVPQNDVGVRRFVTVQMGPVAETLGYSDAWLRTGRADLAVKTIQIGLRAQPKSADLWLALGNALSAASDGAINPPAQFAFAKARELSPDHPGVLFFAGLQAAQANDLEGAARSWLALHAKTPPGAPWLRDLEMRLSALAQLVTESPNSANSGPR